MKFLVSILAATLLAAPNAFAQSKRAALGTANLVQATAWTTRLATTQLIKQFYLVCGGQVQVSYMSRSDGVNNANSLVYVNRDQPCGGGGNSANWVKSICNVEAPAGSTIRVVVNPTTAGQLVGVCCAVLRFNLVDVPGAAAAVVD